MSRVAIPPGIYEAWVRLGRVKKERWIPVSPLEYWQGVTSKEDLLQEWNKRKQLERDGQPYCQLCLERIK